MFRKNYRHMHDWLWTASRNFFAFINTTKPFDIWTHNWLFRSFSIHTQMSPASDIHVMFVCRIEMYRTWINEWFVGYMQIHIVIKHFQKRNKDHTLSIHIFAEALKECCWFEVIKRTTYGDSIWQFYVMQLHKYAAKKSYYMRCHDIVSYSSRFFTLITLNFFFLLLLMLFWNCERELLVNENLWYLMHKKICVKQQQYKSGLVWRKLDFKC